MVEVEARGSGCQGYPRLNTESAASLGYMKSCPNCRAFPSSSKVLGSLSGLKSCMWTDHVDWEAKYLLIKHGSGCPNKNQGWLSWGQSLSRALFHLTLLHVWPGRKNPRGHFWHHRSGGGWQWQPRGEYPGMSVELTMRRLGHTVRNQPVGALEMVEQVAVLVLKLDKLSLIPKIRNRGRWRTLKSCPLVSTQTWWHTHAW